MNYVGLRDFYDQTMENSSAATGFLTALISVLVASETVAVDLMVTLPSEIVVLIRVAAAGDKTKSLNWIARKTHELDRHNHLIQCESQPYKHPSLPPRVHASVSYLTCLVRTMSGIGHVRATMVALIFLRKVILRGNNIVSFEQVYCAISHMVLERHQ